MHRSGTTLVARLLSGLGAHLGAELDAYHESTLFQGVNDRLLERAAASWARPDRFVDAMEGTDHLAAAEQDAVEATSGVEIVNGNRKVKGAGH